MIESKIKIVESLYLFNYAPASCNLKRQVQLQLQPSQTSGFASSSLPEPLTGETKKSISIQLISNHLQIQLCDPRSNPSVYT